MARRRDPGVKRPERAAGEVPRWVRSTVYGLRHVAEQAGQEPDLMRHLGPLREARARWCAENGCHRVGKTCREVFGGRIPQTCAAAGGPAGEQMEG